MSRKDYQAQAAMIKNLRDLGYDMPTLRRVADELADMNAAGNDRFDRARFMIAAGVMIP